MTQSTFVPAVGGPEPVSVQTLGAILLAVAVAAGYIFKVWLDYKLKRDQYEADRQAAAAREAVGGADWATKSGPRPIIGECQCKLDQETKDAIHRLEQWHAPDDPSTGRQSWKNPADHHPATVQALDNSGEVMRRQGEILGEIAELRTQVSDLQDGQDKLTRRFSGDFRS